MNFKGKIYYQGDEGYEEARVGRVFNHRRPERYPAAVFFPENDEKNKTWLKNIMNQIAPVILGQYLGDSDFTTHQRKFISNENYEKLETIRAQREPDGRFHSYIANKKAILNQNLWD